MTITLEVNLPHLDIHWENQNTLESGSPAEKERLTELVKKIFPDADQKTIDGVMLLPITERLHRAIQKTISHYGAQGLTLALNNHLNKNGDVENAPQVDVTDIVDTIENQHNSTQGQTPVTFDTADTLGKIFESSTDDTRFVTAFDDEQNATFLVATKADYDKLQPKVF